MLHIPVPHQQHSNIINFSESRCGLSKTKETKIYSLYKPISWISEYALPKASYAVMLCCNLPHETFLYKTMFCAQEEMMRPSQVPRQLALRGSVTAPASSKGEPRISFSKPSWCTSNGPACRATERCAIRKWAASSRGLRVSASVPALRPPPSPPPNPACFGSPARKTFHIIDGSP